MHVIRGDYANNNPVGWLLVGIYLDNLIAKGQVWNLPLRGLRLNYYAKTISFLRFNQ